MEVLQIYDRNHTKVLGLKDFKDLKIESVLSTGDKSLSFLYPSKYSSYLENEGYIRTKENEYVIKTIDEINDWNSIDATLNLESLEGNAFESFDSTEETIQSCIQLAIAGTGWTVNVIDNITKRRTVRKTDSTVIDILQEIRKTYLVEIEYDTLNKVIKVYEKLGKDKGCYFMDSLNLKQLDVNKDSYDFYTRIIAIGATDEDTKTTLKVTVDNNQYSNKVKTLLWKDERYTVESSLREDAISKLKELSKPRISYKADIYDLANLNIKYKNILDYSLGDTVTLIDKEKGIKEKQRIVKIEEYPNEPEKNSCELSNAVYTFEDIMKSQQAVESTVNNITSDDGTISPDAIRSTLVKMINVDIQNLNAVSAKIGELFANKLRADVANIDTGIVGHLLSQKIETKDLLASNIKFDIAEGGSMTVLDLLAQFISANNVQAMHFTGDNVVIDDAVIKSAMIDSISANKVTAGTLDTNKVTVLSTNGDYKLKLFGGYLQILDKDSNVLMQLGVDATGNVSLILCDENGQQMLTTKGLTKEAIKDAIIVNDMVADNANISGSKLDIESLFNVINNDGTHTFKDSKIKLSDSDQTLDVAFKEMNTKVNNIKPSGENLLRYSRSFNQNWWTGRYNAELTNETTYKGLICYKTTGQWGRLDQGYEVEQGKTYTFSAYIKGVTNSTPISFSFFSGNADIVDTNVKMGDAHTYWYRYSHTFTAKSTGGVRLGFQPSQSDINGTTKYLLVCGLKLCEGDNNIYTENPLDYKPTSKNLYRGTGTFDSKYWTTKNLLPFELNTKYNMVKYNYGDTGIDVLSTPIASQGFNFSDTKKVYTISARFKASNDNMTIGITVSTGRIAWQKKPLTKGKWVQLYWTFAGDGKTLEKFRFEGLTGQEGDYLYISQLKVSESALADDWCPHEMDDLEKALWLEDNMNKSRNYCLRDWYCKYNTVLNIEDKTDYYSIKCIKLGDGHHAYAKLSKTLEVGKTYTVSICLKNNQTVIFRPYEWGTPATKNDFKINIAPSTDYKIYSSTFKVVNDEVNSIFFTSTDFKAIGNEVDVKWVMLNEGELTKDFQLAPEDIISKTNTLQTEFNVQQGKISDLIKDTTIEVSGTSTKLKDAYSQFVQTQNGVNLTVANLNTEVLGADGNGGIKQQVKSVETKVTDEALSIQVHKNKNSKYKVRYIRDWLNGSTASSNNLWNMIQVWNNTGIDRAKGKTVISNLAITNPAYVIDNDYSTNASGTGKQYVQIDLGQVYEDIDVIKVWHYYVDGRTFHGTKTEISADGTHWTTLFDSSISGEYAESRNGHYVKVNDTGVHTTNATIDETGLTIEDGGIRIKSKYKEVFGVDTDGNLKMQGIFEQADSTTGYKSIEIKNNGMRFYDWHNKDDCVGKIEGSVGGMVVRSDTGNSLEIGIGGVNGGSYTDYIVLDDNKTLNKNFTELGIHRETGMFSNLKFAEYNNIEFFGNDLGYTCGKLGLSGNNNVWLAGHYGLNNEIRLGRITNEGYGAFAKFTDGSSYIWGNLGCSGTKSRLVDVGNHYLSQNAYETCECYFGDITECKTDDDGLCKIYYDEDFLKTVNTKISYHVFTSVYGSEEMTDEELRNTWVRCIKKEPTYCIIKGSPNTFFCFEIKAKQKDYENVRLQRVEKEKNEQIERIDE